MRSRLSELTLGQLVALRFAGDAEVAELVAGRLTRRDEIERRARTLRRKR